VVLGTTAFLEHPQPSQSRRAAGPPGRPSDSEAPAAPPPRRRARTATGPAIPVSRALESVRVAGGDTAGPARTGKARLPNVLQARAPPRQARASARVRRRRRRVGLAGGAALGRPPLPQSTSVRVATKGVRSAAPRQ
jgi:hypothetical protein